MKIHFTVTILSLSAAIAMIALSVYIAVLVVRALKKYLRDTPKRDEAKAVRMSLSERLRENRMRCRMTQEFVADAVGVSRQAVSRWENGSCDPSTANLIALAKLYGIPAQQLLEDL